MSYPIVDRSCLGCFSRGKIFSRLVVLLFVCTVDSRYLDFGYLDFGYLDFGYLE